PGAQVLVAGAPPPAGFADRKGLRPAALVHAVIPPAFLRRVFGEIDFGTVSRVERGLERAELDLDRDVLAELTGATTLARFVATQDAGASDAGASKPPITPALALRLRDEAKPRAALSAAIAA